MNDAFKSILLAFMGAMILSCRAPRALEIKLVSQKVSTEIRNNQKNVILKEYYVVRNYDYNDVAKITQVDTTAFMWGILRGADYDLYSINFFSSKHKFEKDSILFHSGKDSLSISRSRKNIANYFFKRGMFHDKQPIKNGKILPPVNDSIEIRHRSRKIEMIN